MTTSPYAQRLVMKFGGAATATVEQFSQLADLVKQAVELGRQVCVVVSAMGDMTDQLLTLAKSVTPHPPSRELDMLLSTGERVSMSLLAMALQAKGVNAVSFTGSQAGIVTCGQHNDARIQQVRPHRLLPHLDKGTVVIVAGFQGVSVDGEITTLGRGGSDTSAVALAIALGAPVVEFYKDVPGIFDRDPKMDPQARLIPHLTHADLLHLLQQGGQILHPRCVMLAQNNRIALQVRPFYDTSVTGTWVGAPVAEEAEYRFDNTAQICYEVET